MASAQTGDGHEPRFSLPPSTPLSSKTELVVGGLRIYVYGLEEVNASQSSEQTGEVVVLYMAHNRTRTYRVMEDMAHEILHRYRTDKRKGRSIGLIAVTMNMRNHGDREVDSQANKTWKNGNENHAMDLVSMISGSAQDFKLVLDYLPTYFPQFTQFYNIMFGVSLGGHTAWRIASLTSPGQICAYAMVVGCPSLSTLLLSRLGIDPTIGNSPGEPFDYEKLRRVMDPTQQKRWPRALAEIVDRDDQQVTDEFPADVPLLLCNGKYDKLVPAKYTAAWVKDRQQQLDGKQDITFFVQDNTGHSCTKEMVAMTAVWLRDILSSSSPQPAF